MDFHLPDYLYAGLTENKTGEVRPLLTRLSLWPNCPRFVVIPSTHLWQKAQLTTRRWTIFGQTILCQTGPNSLLFVRPDIWSPVRCSDKRLVGRNSRWARDWNRLLVWHLFTKCDLTLVTNGSASMLDCHFSILVQVYTSLQVCTGLYKYMQVYARLNTMQLRCTLPFPEEVPHPRSHQHSTESIIFCRQDFDLIFWPSLHSLYCRK